MIEVCLNGRRTRGEHPRVPLAPHELAAAATAAAEAGATGIHLHPRDRSGAESLAAPDVGAAVAAVRRACPGVPVGVTTGPWTYDDVGYVSWWGTLDDDERPDTATVNLAEPGAATLVEVLHGLDVPVEAGVGHPSDVDVLIGLTGNAVCRVLVEVVDVPSTAAVAAATEVLARLDARGVAAPVLLRGQGSTCWALIAHAGWLDLPTRIGLEDAIWIPGDPGFVRDLTNAPLVVQEAMVWWREGRQAAAGWAALGASRG